MEQHLCLCVSLDGPTHLGIQVRGTRACGGKKMPKSGHSTKLTPFPFFPQRLWLLMPRNQTNKLCSPSIQPNPHLSAYGAPFHHPSPSHSLEQIFAPPSVVICTLGTNILQQAPAVLALLTKGQRPPGFPSLLKDSGTFPPRQQEELSTPSRLWKCLEEVCTP